MEKAVQIMRVEFDSSKKDLLNQCAELYCQIWKEPPWNEGFWTSDQVIQDMQNELSMPCSRCFMAINQKVVGFTWGYSVDKEVMRKISQGSYLDRLFSVQVKVYYIDELGVSTFYRGKGIGKQLTLNLVEYAKTCGHTIVTLRTDKQAVEARSVYEKLGFMEQLITDTKYTDRTYWILYL